MKIAICFDCLLIHCLGFRTELFKNINYGLRRGDKPQSVDNYLESQGLNVLQGFSKDYWEDQFNCFLNTIELLECDHEIIFFSHFSNLALQSAKYFLDSHFENFKFELKLKNPDYYISDYIKDELPKSKTLQVAYDQKLAWNKVIKSSDLIVKAPAA